MNLFSSEMGDHLGIITGNVNNIEFVCKTKQSLVDKNY